MSPHFDPELEESKPIFLHDTLAHDVASPYQVGYRWFSSWGDIVQMNIHWNSDLSVTLTLTTRGIQSFHKTIHLMMMYHQTEFSCKRIGSSDLWPWSWRQQTNLFQRQSGSYCRITTAKASSSKTVQRFWKYLDKHSLYFEILLWFWPWTQQSNFSIKQTYDLVM